MISGTEAWHPLIAAEFTYGFLRTAQYSCYGAKFLPCPFRLRVAAGWPSFAAPRLFFQKIIFRGEQPRGRRPPPSRIRRPAVGCLLPRARCVSPVAFVPVKKGGSLCAHAVTEGVGGRRAEQFSRVATHAVHYSVYCPCGSSASLTFTV